MRYSALSSWSKIEIISLGVVDRTLPKLTNSWLLFLPNSVLYVITFYAWLMTQKNLNLQHLVLVLFTFLSPVLVVQLLQTTPQSFLHRELFIRAEAFEMWTVSEGMAQWHSAQERNKIQTFQLHTTTLVTLSVCMFVCSCMSSPFVSQQLVYVCRHKSHIMQPST